MVKYSLNFKCHRIIIVSSNKYILPLHTKTSKLLEVKSWKAGSKHFPNKSFNIIVRVAIPGSTPCFRFCVFYKRNDKLTISSCTPPPQKIFLPTDTHITDSHLTTECSFLQANFTDLLHMGEVMSH